MAPSRFRLAPAICMHCPRPAQIHARYPRLARHFCSDRCAWNHHQQQSNTESIAAATRIRELLGIQGRGGRYFTRPELVAMARRLERVVPAGGISRYPAPHRSNGGVGMRKAAS